MKFYMVICTNKDERVIRADVYKFIREKGGACRYEFYEENRTVATFNFDFVNAICELR